MTAPLIAIVDDDPTIVDLVHDILTDEGYRTTSVATAEDVLFAIQEQRPDLILLDIWLESPQAGWDLLQQLCSDPSTAAIPIIVSSADIACLRSKAEECAASGVSVLEKPFHIETLVEMVARLLERPSDA